MKLLVLVGLLCALCTSQASELEPEDPSGLAEGDGLPGLVTDYVDTEELPVLVRCRRPMCKMYCEFGFELGEDECEICSCKEDPCLLKKCEEGFRCHGIAAECIPECPMLKCVACDSGRYFKDQHGCQTCDCMPVGSAPVDLDHPLEPCPMPMCATVCEHGLKKNAAGCMTCECLEAPPAPAAIACAMPMCIDSCPGGYKNNEFGCMTCECIAEPADITCPDVMCAMYCEYGFLKNQYGCDTCVCKDDPCTGVECVAGLICDSKKGVCTVPSLCELMKEMGDEDFPVLSDLFGDDINGGSQCLSDGSFTPRQCDVEGLGCWCVDDRGRRIPEVERQEWELSEDSCSPRISKMMRVSLDLMHDLDTNDLEGAIKDVEELVSVTLGDWLGINKDAIVQVQVTHTEPGVITVEIDIISDGVTDLPSAAHHLHKKVNNGDCQFPFGDHMIKAKPGSVHAKHQYIDDPAPPVYVDEPYTSAMITYCRSHMVFVIVVPVVSAILLIILTICCCKACKKRSGRYQFTHKKLESLETFKKNLILSSEWENPELVCKEEVSVNITDPEKKALA